MVFAYFFTLRALTKFCSQYPQSTLSIMKEASTSLWPKGDRLTGSIIALLVQLLVTLALSTCWGSRSPPITALERCPCWLHRADQAYGWLICLESQVQTHQSWLHLGPSWHYPPSLTFFSLIFQCKVNSLLKSTCGKAHRWTQSYTPSLQSFNLHPLVPWSFPCYLNFLI